MRNLDSLYLEKFFLTPSQSPLLATQQIYHSPKSSQPGRDLIGQPIKKALLWVPLTLFLHFSHAFQDLPLLRAGWSNSLLPKIS